MDYGFSTSDPIRGMQSKYAPAWSSGGAEGGKVNGSCFMLGVLEIIYLYLV